jgi:hypothetical protein
MLFYVVFFFLLDLVSAHVARAPESVSSDNCKVGLYAKLAILKYYGPAQSFCRREYPTTVTVTAHKVKRGFATSTTTWISSTTTTYKSTTTTMPAMTTTSTVCTKDALACLFSSIIGNNARTVSDPTSGRASYMISRWFPESATQGRERHEHQLHFGFR